MKVILFSDTHFGIRQNAMSWFRAQMDFFHKQFIPYIKSLDEDFIMIHLGDVFDSRSSINTYIAKHVQELFAELAGIAPLYIVCGNHDYYSPTDETYNNVELLLGSIENGNLHIVSDVEYLPILPTPPVLLPWFAQEKMTPTEYTEKYRDHFIFTHSDIIMGNPKLMTNVFSGHVHKPYINGKIRNLGSCFATDFHDANQDRYFYVWDPEYDELTKVKNEYMIRFWRIHDSNILERGWNIVKPNDYIEVYIKYSLFQRDEYQAKCDWIRKNFKNSWIIPIPEELSNEAVDIDCNIESIIEHSIPDDLRERFEVIKQKVHNDCTNE